MDLNIENMLAKREVRKAYGGGKLPLGTVVGDWKVVAFVGEGGSAEVYRVVGTKMDGEAALKLLVNEKPEYRERFMHEMEVMRTLAVSSIPRFFGSGEIDGRPWYAMEYLQPLLFPVKSPRDFAILLALGVSELHAAGYVHCDLKPTNVMQRKDGEIVLADLGLVRKIGGRGGSGAGTKGYAAPEQLLDGVASVRGDVFSMGKILKAAMKNHSTHRLRAIVRKATHEDPEERYASADAFAKAVAGSRWSPSLKFLLAAVLVFAAFRIGMSFLLVPERKSPREEAEELVDQIEKTMKDRALIEKTKELSFDELLVKAESGDADAQARLAEAYFHGRGTETNKAEAVAWYERAAEAGHPGAMDSLGLCRLYGYGCEKDAEAAARLFSAAAAKNHLSAMNNLAYCCMNGIGTDRDEQKAFRWASAAASEGHAPAQTMVAECYLTGRGVEKDEQFAKMWLERAAKGGNRRARMLLEALE